MSEQRRLSDWLPQLATPAVGLLGFLVYAISAGGYQAFFRQFNVNLDEVGLGQASIVAQAGVHLVSWLLSLGIFVALFLLIEKFAWLVGKSPLKAIFTWLKTRFTSLGQKVPRLKKPFTWLGEKMGKKLAETLGGDIVLVAAASWLFRLSIRALLKTLVLQVGRGESFLRPLGQSLPFHLALPLLGFVDLGIISIHDIRPQAGRKFPKSLWVWLLVISVVGFTVLAHSDIVAQGQKDGSCIQDGGVPTSPLLGIPTEPVSVQWADATLGQAFGQDRFLLLGNGKMLILWDLSQHLSIRVLPDKVAQIASIASPLEPTQPPLMCS